MAIDAQHGSAWIHYTATNVSKSWVETSRSNHPSVRYDVTAGDGSKSIFIGFLSPSTDYSYRIVSQGIDGLRVESVNGSFQTAASPYAWATGNNVKIRPGELTDTGCTLSFIFRDATNETLYAATAGHCADKKPQGSTWRVAHQADTPIGVIAAYEYNEGGVLDWALIRIAPESRAFVSPSVRHWTGPTGVAIEADVAKGDTVCLYGWGQGYQTFEATRHRCGEFEWWWTSSSSETSFTEAGYSIPSAWGDSGSPVIDYTSGRAVAIAAHFSTGTNGVVPGGSAIFSVIERAAAHGIQVQLATAPYVPPPPDDY